MCPRPRDPWLDNVKMILVTLVVVGHSWGLLSETDANKRIYDFLYYWHIPAFVLVTGYLSRNFTWDRRGFRSLLTTCVVPYVIFEPALYVFRARLGEDSDGPVLLVPHWAMWYLCVLFFWRLAAPILKRHWAWIPASVVISLLGGLTAGEQFAMPRVLGLLPFFVIGLHLNRRALDKLSEPWLKPLAVGALVWIWVVAAGLHNWGRSLFLLYDDSYADLGWSAGEGMQVRFTVMAIGLLGATAALILIPRSQTWFTSLGSGSLVVYLFHTFVIRYAAYAGWLDWSESRPTLAFVVATAAATGLATLLAYGPVRRALTWVADPVGSIQRRRSRSAVEHRTPARAPDDEQVRELVGPKSG